MFAGLGVVLIVAGAIVKYAIDDTVDGVDLSAVGIIMIVGGLLSLAIAAIRAAGWMSMSHRKFETERHVSPDGTHYVEETRTH